MLSLVHLIYMAGDKCMRQNACSDIVWKVQNKYSFEYLVFVSFPHFDSDFNSVKMSSHQTSAKPRSSKCRHFCFLFDNHNYSPTCRESGKGDDPCLTNQSPCNISANFSEE